MPTMSPSRIEVRSLDSLQYPTFGMDAEMRVVWSNEAARRRFRMTDHEMAAVDPFDLGDFDREFKRRHLSAWLSGGTLSPVPYRWDAEPGRGDFLLVPFPVPETSGAACALVLIPSPVLADRREPRLVQEASPAGDASAPRPLRFASLTPREWEIARRLASGDRVLLLAEELGIAPSTVRNHLRAIFRKLGLRSQVQLVRAVRDSADPAARRG